MYGTLARTSILGRSVMRNFIRNGSHGGVPGENLPFDMSNRYKLTALFIVYIGSGISAPFLITRHQLLKK
ncbi:cytochrome c oxidase subunit 7C, mitochondrial-like [Pararge aegeria]|uniref:cytochrome c oxidase subunit 7C, mitochondrial-like n=1 Tax=Pararge aegeria TaxID=116150 RepID=UPI0019D1F986|nr:cytochrome c oxidase subunit 7C, mitochondrial-like [Pararge aegeria]